MEFEPFVQKNTHNLVFRENSVEGSDVKAASDIFVAPYSGVTQTPQQKIRTTTMKIYAFMALVIANEVKKRGKKFLFCPTVINRFDKSLFVYKNCSQSSGSLPSMNSVLENGRRATKSSHSFIFFLLISFGC